MMLVDLLQKCGLRPGEVKLARHNPHRELAALIVPNRRKFEKWQAIQKNAVFDRCEIIVACQHLPNQARICRLYKKVGREELPLLDAEWARRGLIPQDVLSAMRQRRGYNRKRKRYFYHLRPMREIPELKGRIIEWSGRTWHQWANSQPRRVLPVSAVNRR